MTQRSRWPPVRRIGVLALPTTPGDTGYTARTGDHGARRPARAASLPQASEWRDRRDNGRPAGRPPAVSVAVTTPLERARQVLRRARRTARARGRAGHRPDPRRG